MVPLADDFKAKRKKSRFSRFLRNLFIYLYIRGKMKYKKIRSLVSSRDYSRRVESILAFLEFGNFEDLKDF